MKKIVKLLIFILMVSTIVTIYEFRQHQLDQEELQKQELKKSDKLKWQLVKMNKTFNYHLSFTPRLFVVADIYPLNRNIKNNLEIRYGSVSFEDLNEIGCYPKLEISELQENGFYGPVSQCDFYIMINDNFKTLRQIEGSRLDDTLLLQPFNESESYYFLERALLDSNKITFFIRRNDLKGKPMFFVEYQTKGFVSLDSYVEHEIEFMKENHFTPEDMNCSYGPGKCR